MRQIIITGGGPDNTLSGWGELGPLLTSLLGRDIPVSYADWRPGDQRVFVTDIRKAARLLNWEPRISPAEGVRAVFDWIQAEAKSGLAAPSANPRPMLNHAYDRTVGRRIARDYDALLVHSLIERRALAEGPVGAPSERIYCVESPPALAGVAPVGSFRLAQGLSDKFVVLY